MSRTLVIAVAAFCLSAADAAPIALHPRNPHYFLFNGRAVALIGNGEHYGAVLNADVDYKRYLATIQSGGLNFTRIFGGAYIEVPAKSFGIKRNDLAPNPGRYIAPWIRTTGNKLDLDHWNPAYFERLHDFLADASHRGIVVELTLFSSFYGDAQWEVNPFNPANNINQIAPLDWKKAQTLDNGKLLHYQEQYTRKLVHEVNGFDNVILEIQNEPWSDHPRLASVINPYLPVPGRDKYPNSIDIADPDSLAWQERVASWIVAEQRSLPNQLLVAQNYSNFGIAVSKLIPEVSVVNFHYAYPEAVLMNYGLNKAISYDETGFLGTADDSYARQAWNFMLAGGSVFDGLDYSFSPGHEDGSDPGPNGPGGGSAGLRRQLKVLSDFMQTLPLVEMKPDLQTVKHAAGVKTHMISSSGVYAMYVDGDGPVEITLDLPAGSYSGDWVDSATGAVLKNVSLQHQGGIRLISTPGFRNGAALRLKREPVRNSPI